MNEKTLNNVRIVNKHDTEANWLKATGFTPKQGELIVYDKDSTHNYERLKIGDGSTVVSSLPFADANKVDKVSGKGLSTNDYTAADKNKLAGIAEGANKTVVDSSLSTSSTNPVQNKVVNAAIGNLKSLVGDTSVSDQIDDALDIALFFKYLNMQMPTGIKWTDITYGDGKYVAIATDSNIAAYSTDGMNWTQTTMPTTAQWNRVVYGSGVFIATAYFTNVCAYSSNGIDWVQGSVVTNLKYTSLVYDGSYGMFYAVPEEGYAYKYTMDGSDWGQDSLPVTAMWSDMTFDGSQCIIVARYSNKILCGNLGYWEEKTHNLSGLIAVSSNGNGLTVALGEPGSGYACWTNNRSAWNNVSIGNRNWSDIAYGNGKFVIVTSGSDYAAYSADGASWTEVRLPSVESWTNVTYGNGQFVACAYGSDAVAISSDGIVWRGAEKMILDKDGNDVTSDIENILGIDKMVPKLATITLNASDWAGVSNPYHQDIVINGATKNSKIDLQPTAFQIVELQNADIMLMVENRDTFSRVYAIGGKPTKNYEMQALITEVVHV